MVISKTLSLSRSDYYRKHLGIINAILPEHLTPREIEILAEFMSLNGSIAHDRFGTTARKLVMGNLNLTLPGLSNHLKNLKDKKFIRDDRILPILFPDLQEQGYAFKLINYEEEE